MATAGTGRKSRPLALKLIQGRAPGRDSGGRLVGSTPQFRRITPTKPDEMTSDASALWDEIVAELPRLELLKPLDGPALQMLCEEYSTWCVARRMTRELGLTHSTSQGVGAAPWVGIAERSSRNYRAWCAEFGLTPAAEMKLIKAEAEGDGTNPYAASAGTTG